MKTKQLYLLGFLCLLTACGREKEPFDVPYINILTDKGASSTVIKSDVNNVNTYMVYVSSHPLTTNLEVNYEISIGNGLQQGVDFELVTKGNTLTFLPGIYDMPIRIRWIPHRVDPAKNNKMRITLTGNNLGLTLGVPGPDGLQRELIIEKQN